jgi:hypothetical protein
MYSELEANTEICNNPRLTQHCDALQVHTFGVCGVSAQRNLEFANGGSLTQTIQVGVILAEGSFLSAAARQAAGGMVDTSKLMPLLTTDKSMAVLTTHSMATLVGRSLATPSYFPLYVSGIVTAMAKQEAVQYSSLGADITHQCFKFRPQTVLPFTVTTVAAAIVGYSTTVQNKIYIPADGLTPRECAILMNCVCGVRSVSNRPGDAADPNDLAQDWDVTTSPPELNGGAVLAVGALAGNVDPDLHHEPPAPDFDRTYDGSWIPPAGYAEYAYNEVEVAEDEAAPELYPDVLPPGAPIQRDDGKYRTRFSCVKVQAPQNGSSIEFVHTRIGANATTNPAPNDIAVRVRNIQNALAPGTEPVSPAEIFSVLGKLALLVADRDAMSAAFDLVVGAARPHSTGMLNRSFRHAARTITLPALMTERSLFAGTITDTPTLNIGFDLPSPMDCLAIFNTAAMLEAASISSLQASIAGLKNARPGSIPALYQKMTTVEFSSLAVKNALGSFCSYQYAKIATGTRRMGELHNIQAGGPMTLYPPEPYTRFEILTIIPGTNVPFFNRKSTILDMHDRFVLEGNFKFHGLMQAWHQTLSTDQRNGLIFLPHVMSRRTNAVTPLVIAPYTNQAQWEALFNAPLPANARLRSDMLRAKRYVSTWSQRGEGVFPVTALPLSDDIGQPVIYHMMPFRYRGSSAHYQAGLVALQQLRNMLGYASGDASAPFVTKRLKLEGTANNRAAEVGLGRLDAVADLNTDPEALALFSGDAAPEAATHGGQSGAALAPSPFGVLLPGNPPPGSAQHGAAAGGGGAGGGAGGALPPAAVGGARQEILQADGILTGADANVGH